MQYSFIIIPIITAIASQIVKLSIDGIKGNLTLKHVFSDYSGMPSSHSAFVASIAALAALAKGFNSLEFGITLVLAIVVIRDALGFRRHLGSIAQKLNQLSPNQKLPTRFGHKPIEVIMGVLFGAILSFILYYL